MFQATAQSIVKKAPQQAARIQNAARTVSTDSFAFYPVQRNRIRTAKQNTSLSFSFYPAEHTATANMEASAEAFYPVQRNRIQTAKQNSSLSYSFYPANKAKVAAPTASINDAKAVRATLMKKKKKMASTKNWESVMQTLKAVKKTTTALP